MAEQLCFCFKCNKLFTKKNDLISAEATSCPYCHSLKNVDLKKYPAHMDDAELGPPPWEFICFKCSIFFEVPSPSTPEQAKTMHCPICQSKDIKQLNVLSLDNLDHTCFG